MIDYKKIAFIHFNKCAGTYINNRIKFSIKDIDIYDPWNPPHILWRDYTEDEILEISKSRTGYIHCHHGAWTLKSIDMLDGWFKFSFLREVEDIICSLWHFYREKNFKTSIESEVELKLLATGPLDTFINKLISDEVDYSILWKIPEYIDKLDFVKIVSEDNFYKLFNKLNLVYAPSEKENVSKNVGYWNHLKNGDISQKTHNNLFNNIDVINHKIYLNKIKD